MRLAICQKAMIASVSTFLYMSFWLCVLDKANNSLRYVHVSCDKRLLLCYLMLRAAASCCRLHRSSQQHLYKLACNHRLMTILTYTWRENDGNLPSKNVRNGRVAELLYVVKIMAKLAVVCR